MAKQRLVDFRGGLNDLISPHMIGDSQGQDALNVDLSAVRLQGRLEIDPSSTADGSFFYEYGNVSATSFDGRWVSIYPEDTNTYLAGATDFAVWNKDLYVAYGEGSTDGKLRVYRDSADVAEVLDFNPPSSLSIATYNATVQSGTYTQSGTTLTFTFSDVHELSVGDIFTVEFTSGTATDETLTVATVTSTTVLTATSANTATTSGNFTRTDFLVPYSLDDTSEVLIDSVAGIDYVPPQTGIYPVTSAAGTGEALISAFNPPYTFVAYNSSHSRNTYSNGTTYYEDPNTKRLQQNTGGSAGYTVTLSLSTVNQFNPIYQSAGTFNDYSNRPYSGIANFTFNLYTRNGTTYYYAPSSNSTLGVSGGSFYTQNAGSGGSTGGNSVTDPNTTGSYNASTDYWKWVRNAGFTGNVTTSNYSTLNSSYGTSYSPSTTGYYDQRSGTSNQTFNLYTEGGTTYYAPTSNATINGVSLTAGTFYTQGGGGSTTSSTEGPNVYNGYYWYITDPFGTNRIEIYWGNVLKATISPANYNLTEHVASDGYKYIRGSLYQSANYPYIYAVSRNITTNNDFTYSAHSRTLSSSNGTLYFVFGGSTKSTTSNISYATAESSNTTYTTTETINGSSVSVTYRRGTNFAVNQTDTKAYSIYRTYTAPTVYNNYTYSIHTNSQSFPATYTYADITDTIPAVTGKPETPAFTYDKARSKIYLEYNSDSDVNSEDTDNAQGAQWLLNRDFSLTDNGYYLKTVRESNNLPQVSSSGLKATLASNNSYVFGASLEHTPQRLNFTIGTPTDNATAGTTLKGYKLERRDSIGTVDLGYISPDTGVSFDYTPSTKAVTITLPTSTTDKYRLKFSGYQNTHVQLNSLTAVKSNMSGFTFTGSSNKPTITLIPQDGASQQFLAADFWLERVIIDGATSADDIYATVRCFDVFDRNGNAVSSGTIEGTSDFLDVFPNGLSSGAITDSGAEEGVPTYLKFLRESNNFFFAVGTDSTPNNRYASTNKADSYLFISEYNNPRSWPLSGYLEFDGSITGLASYPGELIAFTEGGVYRVTGSRYDQMRKTKLATTEGMPIGHHRSLSLVNRYLCWVSQTGICIYNGESVTNITRGRLENFNLTGSSVHAGQFEDVYYVVDSSETGYSVDFSLEGFPVSRIDLTEGDTTTPSNSASPPETLPPVLVYRPSVNRLYSRRGVIEGVSTRNLWNYKTRAFDGGAFGSIKLVRNVTVNGTGSGKIQIYLDGKPVFKNSSNVATPKTISITDSTTSTRTEPARVYVPATSDTIYGLSVADVWSVEITDWNGRIDWIDTEYEILSGG